MKSLYFPHFNICKRIENKSVQYEQSNKDKKKNHCMFKKNAKRQLKKFQIWLLAKDNLTLKKKIKNEIGTLMKQKCDKCDIMQYNHYYNK